MRDRRRRQTGEQTGKSKRQVWDIDSCNGAGRGVIPGRVDISEHPVIDEEKVCVGDWEVDMIVGARHSGVIVSLVDRASKFTFLQSIDYKTAAEAVATIIDCLGPMSDLLDDHGRQRQGVRGARGGVEGARRGLCLARPYHS